MSRLSMLRIGAKDPKVLADFYRKVFGLEAVREAEGTVFLTDGCSEVALLPVTSEGSPGLREMGFAVEDLAAFEKAIRQQYPEIDCTPSLTGDGEAALRVTDPDGNPLVIFRAGATPREQSGATPFRHIALYTPDPRRLADFYTAVLEMREVARTNRSSIFVSDGRINLALLYERPGEEQQGLNHFGFHVTDNVTMQRSVADAGGDPGAPRPKRIPFSEFRVHDPEGNGIDISEKGWKV